LKGLLKREESTVTKYKVPNVNPENTAEFLISLIHKTMNEVIKLTSFSHGAGCGCKLSPKVLSTILETTSLKIEDPRLLVGNDTRDDAAVYDMGNGIGIISTTDFFLPYSR